MVYHGRPSSGCACCKRRRKKCDETHPQCRNCQKIGVECPGFPDKLDIMFKDETPILMQRARKSPKRSPRPSNSPPRQTSEATAAPSVTRTLSSSGLSDSAWSVISSEFSKGATQPRLDGPSQSYEPTFVLAGDIPLPITAHAPTLPIPQSDSPLTEELTRRFLSHFEQAADQHISTPGLNAIIKPWLELVPPESALRLVVQAIAVRTMANHYQRPDLVGSANALYYQAMANVQLSIVETPTRIYDDTLLTILLFTAYEAIGATSINNWSDHVRGAYSVLESRAPPRVDSPTSLMLFRATRANVLADSLRRWEPMPELSGSDGWLEGEPHSAGGHIFDHFVELTCLLARTKELWASTSRSEEGHLEAENMIERAIKLQEVFADPQACTQRDCHCVGVVEFENADKGTTTDLILRLSETEAYPRYSVQTSPSRHYCHIGQLYCSRLIARLSAWIEPQGYADNERFQSASLWTKHLHEVVQASVPSYLAQLDKEGPQEYANMDKGPGHSISISGLAQGLHMPPLHWVLVSANAKG